MSDWCHTFHLPICLVALTGIPIDSPIDSARASQPLPVHIRWAIGAVRAEKENYRFMPIHKDTHLQSGDYFKFYLEALQPVHFYLVHQDPQGRVKPLLVHVSQPQDRPKDRSDPFRLSLPEPDKPWLRFDDQTGAERFYLIASATRLDALETLLETLMNDRSESGAEIGKRVLVEIRRLRKVHKALASNSEQPVALGGQVRGTNPATMPELDWDRLDRHLFENVVEVRVPTFYGRTVTIDHVAP